jgi:tRNA(Ile)-lysidine synthase
VLNRLTPDQAILDRFRADLDPLVTPEQRIGVAVSGGPDSLALLLLVAAARPGLVEAATIDHGLRDESAAEAGMVADIARQLGLVHHVLKIHVPQGASLQAQARGARYRALGDWAVEQSLDAVTTAHHADDQAETLLMRLARGAGLSGLAATRSKRVLEPGIQLVRPLLGWRKSDLVEIVNAAGLEAIDDPSNRDPRHDRSRFRGLVEKADWADADRLALSAQWLSEADEALEWALHAVASKRIRDDGSGISLSPADLPKEMQRRLLLAAFERLGAARPRGPELERAMRAMEAGKSVTLSGLKLKGGADWHITPAPPRRKG